jgi:hypothetical protein
MQLTDWLEFALLPRASPLSGTRATPDFSTVMPATPDEHLRKLSAA